MKMSVPFCLAVLVFLGLLQGGKCVLPRYIPTTLNNGAGRNEIISNYFNLGFSYSEILLFLGLTHGIQLSLRQLKRILKSLGLGRRKNPSNIADIYRSLDEELQGSGSLLGYRQMTQRLTLNWGLQVDRETVRELLRILDPEGVELRSKHRLKRRQYVSKGPNYTWHIDGYDKLKPFGFCVHGAIDGFSRRILWLEVGSTNNDPSVVSQYFVDYVKQLGGTARTIRADCGTENVYISAIQRFFCHVAGANQTERLCVMYGKSVSNQRIEAWWSILRKGCSDWWIKYLKDMRDCGLYSDQYPIHVECLKFCFMDILRNELHNVAKLWNVHKIRRSPNQESPSGRPDTLYFLPEVSLSRDYKNLVSVRDVEIAEARCCQRQPQNGCDQDFSDLANILMHEMNLEMPTNAQEATLLYDILIQAKNSL